MSYSRMLSALAATLAFAPGLSFAQWTSYAAKPLNLRAGPARDYPLVAQVPPGAPISVQGCLSDYQWCDVVAGPNRGWAYANNIYSPYQGTNVPVLTYGAAIGIGIVGFAVGSYWDTHYRGHPWYQQRQHWVDRPRQGFGGPTHHPAYGPGFGPSGHRAPDRPFVARDHHPAQGSGFAPSHRAQQTHDSGGGGNSRHQAQGQGSGGGHRSQHDQGPGGR